MKQATLKTLMERVHRAIERGEDIVYDVASESCQMVDNVSHMHWFKKAVAQEFINTMKAYQHLKLA